VAASWDAIDLYLRTLRIPHRPSNQLNSDVAAGAALYQLGGCASCHAGPKWSISKRAYVPAQGIATGSMTCTLQTTALAKKAVSAGQNADTYHLSMERLGACTTATQVTDCAPYMTSVCNAGQCVIGPERLTCGLRNVGTFGAGPQGAVFEVRSDTSPVGVPLTAHGQRGFNVPSLLGLPTTAPYLHNGAAQTLSDLFSNTAFLGHTNAGNASFSVGLTSTQLGQLVAYLNAIDGAATALAVDPNQDLCVPVTALPGAACTNP
jgi:cytochrome c peroxidase